MKSHSISKLKQVANDNKKRSKNCCTSKAEVEEKLGLDTLQATCKNQGTLNSILNSKKQITKMQKWFTKLSQNYHKMLKF